MEPQTQQSQPQQPLKQPPQHPPAAPPATAKSKSAPEGQNRCRRRTRANGRCRLAVHDPATGLCFKHSAIRKTTHAFDDTCDLSSALFGVSTSDPSFETLEQITQTLTNVVVLVAQGRLSPRRAAVITYALSLVLRGLQAIDKKADDAPVEIICDLPRPVREPAEAQSQQQAPNETSNRGANSSHPQQPSTALAPTPGPHEALKRYYQLRT